MKKIILKIGCILFSTSIHAAQVELPILTLGSPNEFLSYDPRTANSAQDRFMLQLVFSPLIRVDEDQNLVPAFAKSWKVDLTSNKIIFQLSKDFKFSDGSSVEAKDFIRSIQLLCKTKASADLNGLRGCDGTDQARPLIATNAQGEVEISLDNNAAIFLYQLASSRVVIFKEDGGSLIGSGPYKVLSFDRKEVKLRPNKNSPSYESLRNSGLNILFIPEREFHTNVKKVRPHATLMFRASVVGGLALPNYKVVADRPSITEILVLNNQNPLFKSKSLRLNLMSKIYNSLNLVECSPGSIRAFGIIPIGLGGSVGHMGPLKLDDVPADTQKTGKITIHQALERKNDCIAERIRKAFKSVGIDASFKYHDGYDTLFPLYFSHKADAFVELFAFKNREAFSILRYFTSTSKENFANLKASNLDSAVKSAYSAETKGARYAIYQQIARQIQDEANVVPLYYLGQSNYVHNCVTGLKGAFYMNPFENLPQLGIDSDCDFNQ